MSYASIMIHLDLGSGMAQANAARLRVGADLAEAHGAAVIGVAACDPQPQVYADGFVPPDIIEADRAAVSNQMAEAEDLLRASLKSRVSQIEWRSALAPPVDYIARQARATDLLITGTRRESVFLNTGWALDPGDLVMRAGRPVLLAPPDAEGLGPRRVVVGWKDTREARRAIVEALPLLRHAETVFVATVAEAGEGEDATGIADVIQWLARHGVVAQERFLVHEGKAALHLDNLAWEEKADLMVAGAYGHTRLREWMLGGVTRGLVSSSKRCVLLSH